MNELKNNKKGFTIIEVLIVLAIGGLILLVVFLAVPALQRNSRNTQRKSDVSALAGAIQEYNANNGGAVLTVGAAATTGTTPTAATGIFAAINNAKLGFYDTANVFGNSTGTPPASSVVATNAPSSTVVTPDSIIVWIGYDCSAGSAKAPVAGSKRSVAIQSAVEVGGSQAGQVQCTQS